MSIAIRLSLFFISFLIWLSPSNVFAQTVQEIPPGISYADFDDGTKKVMVVKAWRENYNAHGFYVLDFYNPVKTYGSNVDQEDKPTEIAPLQIIPAEKSTKFDLNFTTYQGADCVLQDYRFLEKDKKTYLWEAERDFGTSFADTEKVNFSLWALQKNDDGIPGWPAVYFKLVKKWQAEKKYCDVANAFREEKIPQ